MKLQKPRSHAPPTGKRKGSKWYYVKHTGVCPLCKRDLSYKVREWGEPPPGKVVGKAVAIPIENPEETCGCRDNKRS